jgi:hypothetical protein
MTGSGPWPKWMIVAALWLAGCTLLDDPDDVAQPVCTDDAQCDNGLFCDGLERCAPGATSADLLGCAPGGAPEGLDDGIACTTDRCVEGQGLNQGQLTHDTSACGCVVDEDCQEMDTACRATRCDPATLTCTPGAVEVGRPCNTELACAQGVCDASGVCASTQGARDARCADRNACNGDERCAPEADDADPLTGCAPGQAPTPPEDAPPCALPVCDDAGALTQWSLSACACASDDDCPTLQCRLGACRLGSCEYDDDALAPAQTPCDDGVACTLDDRCDDAGSCRGAASSVFCAQRPCPEGSSGQGPTVCAPDAQPATPDGCACP